MKNDLVYLKDNELWTNSIKIATTFNRRHDSIVKTIQTVLRDLNDYEDDTDDVKIIKSSYVNDQNKQTYGMYVVNELGFTLIANRLHGKDALKFQLAYDRAFKDMAKQLNKSHFVQTLIPKSVKLYTTGQLAKDWNMSAREMNEYLEDWGCIEKNTYLHCWQLKPYYQQYDYTETVRGTNSYGTAYNLMKWTPEGAGWVRQQMINNGKGGPLKERNGDRKLGVAPKPKPEEIKKAFGDLF